MSEYTKISFNHRKDLADYGDLIEMLFPGNRNQQHAAARILLELKYAKGLVRSFKHLQGRFDISRRTLERTRAKLSRLGLIERVSWMNRRYDGREGFKFSTRFGGALRLLADKMDGWRNDRSGSRKEKDELLIGLLEAPRSPEGFGDFRQSERAVTTFK